MLACESLTVGYSATPVLRDVDLTVDEGELVGIIGRNGAGKTTLLKALIGLLEPQSGTVHYDGEDVTDVPADERARRGMGYIPQGRDVFPDLTVEQNLLVGESINGNGDDRGEGDAEMLYDVVYDRFPILEERAGQAAGTLSGGQQQMLAIGRALVGNPDLLLLDEPSEGIQPSIVEQISGDVRAINDDLGTTVLFVEQNLGVIRAMADRCYAMDRGTIVDELSGDDLADEATVASYLAV